MAGAGDAITLIGAAGFAGRSAESMTLVARKAAKAGILISDGRVFLKIMVWIVRINGSPVICGDGRKTVSNNAEATSAFHLSA